MIRAAWVDRETESSTTEDGTLSRALPYHRHPTNRTSELHTCHFKNAATQVGAVQRFIKPQCPWTNGTVECLNRTLANERVYTGSSAISSARTLLTLTEPHNTERIYAHERNTINRSA